MLRRVSLAPIGWLALALASLLLGSRPAYAAPPAQEPATDAAASLAPAAISLPAPLYYIDGYSGQVVRLDVDASSRRTVTRETERVTALDVSPDGSKIAYVSGQRLIEADASGLNPVVKFTGDGYPVSDPVYSPDGSRIAFAYNGVNLIASGPDAGEDAVTVVVADDPLPADGSVGGDVRSYSPVSWSPDGVHLLAQYRYVPSGGSFTILAPDSGVQVDIAPDPDDERAGWYARRGEVAWKPDSTGFYIGNDMFVYDTPGLTLVDAGTGLATGILYALTDSPSPDDPVFLVAGPHVSGGELRAFVWELAGLPPDPTAYVLSAIDSANGERTPLNDQVYTDIGGVLWANDDSGAVLLTNRTYTDAGATGGYQWAPVDGAAASLPIYGSNPRWGAPGVGAASAEEGEVVALFEGALDLNAARSADDLSTFTPSVAFPVQGADGVTWWVAHTTGMRQFSAAGRAHAIGVYVREADGWREVSLLDLVGAEDGVSAGPDYLDPAAVMPVQIGGATDPVAADAAAAETQFWLHVEGGAGAHGGVCEVVRLAGDALIQELDGFSASPGACTVEDVNGDGANEVVLNATDPYVFCYACGVRLPNFGVMRWDGDEFVQVALDPLPAAAPAALSSRNDEVLRLVEGGLWKAALNLVDTPITVTGSLTTSGAVTATGVVTSAAAVTATEAVTATLSDPSGVWEWNKALVRLTGDARRDEAERIAHPYPLLAHTFYGDYPAAVDVMRAYTATELFAMPSALVSGTVAAGWESTLADWITTTTTAAIDVNSQLAGAYFLRGWGVWLGGASAAMTGDLPPDAVPTTDVAVDPATLDAAVADIRRAFELSPDPLYAASLSLLTGEEVPVPAAPVAATPAVTGTQTVSPTAAGAGSPGGAGRIFYSTVQEGIDRIYSLEFGSANATLSEVLAEARQPALQPGGVRLAYQSTRDDMLGLGGYDLDTGNRFNFTTNLEDSLPRWNPEGNRLAFSSTRYGDGRSRVYLAWAQDAEFASEEAVDLGEGSDPDWSPDGTRLVYKGCDETGANCGLWTTAIDGTDRRPLTDNPADARPRWTPDGSRVVFMSDGRDGNWDVYSVLVESGEVTRITFNAASDGLPAVSPDGSEIVFVSNRGDQWGIWRVAIDSGRAESVAGDLGALTNWLEQSLDWVP